MGIFVPIISEPKMKRMTCSDFFLAYANLYISICAMLAPQFNDKPKDQRAVILFKKHLPDSETGKMNVEPLRELKNGIH